MACPDQPESWKGNGALNTGTDPLERARYAIQTGSKSTARQLLADVLRTNPRNVEAWLLMSSAVRDRDKQRECLLRVLALDPDNAAAKAGLDWVQNLAAGVPSDDVTDVAGLPGEPARQPAPDTPRPPSSVTTLTRSPAQVLTPPARPTPTGPDERLRRTGQRNVMLAGALILSLLCGLLLLTITLTEIVPRARPCPAPTLSPSSHTVQLSYPTSGEARRSVARWSSTRSPVQLLLQLAPSAVAQQFLPAHFPGTFTAAH